MGFEETLDIPLSHVLYLYDLLLFIVYGHKTFQQNVQYGNKKATP